MNIAVHVTWDTASVAKDGDVRLVVYKLGQEPVLWKQAGPKGSAETGVGASGGWTIVLVSHRRGKMLATRTLQSKPCLPEGG